MRQVTLASVRVHARRYVAAVVAVTLAVAFIVMTNALTSSARTGLVADLGESFRGADVVVTGGSGGDGGTEPLTAAEGRRVVAAAESAGADAAVNGFAVLPVSAPGGTTTVTSVGTVATDPGLRWQTLASGEWPTGPGQAVADENVAGSRKVGVGDRVEVDTGRGPDTSVEITGLVRSSSGPHSAVLYLTWADLSAAGDTPMAMDVVVRGASVAALDAALPDRFLVQDTEQLVAQLQAQLLQGVDVGALLLLFFAAVATFVAVLVIANMFAVLLAQRQRDFALLRCVGATRKQVVRAVRLEATLVGAASATLGVVVGAALGHLVVAVVHAQWPRLRMGDVELSWQWVLAAWLVGTLVTVGASVLPARRGSRVPALAALRPEPAVSVRTRTGRLRITLAVLLVWVGAALLTLSVTEHQLAPMLAGGFLSFVGVLLLGPVLVPAAIRLVGLLLRPFAGTTGRLALVNAVRNPRRTAGTAASLLVGVTLVTGMVVGMATVRTTVDREMSGEYPVDTTLTAPTPLPAGFADRVAEVDGIGTVRALPGTAGELTLGGTGLGRQVLLAPPDGTDAVVRGEPAFLPVPDDVMYLPWDAFADYSLTPDRTVTVRLDGEQRRLEVRGGEGFGHAALVSPGTLAALGGGAGESYAVWAAATEGADVEEVAGELKAMAEPTGAELEGGLSSRAFVDLQLDIMLGAVLALLGIGVVIALVGVGTTLGLSVLERTREHALLRALGLTRRQLRRTLSVEAALLAGVAGLLGGALGTTYAWIGVRAMVGDIADDVVLVLPWGQLALVVLVATGAGLLAGVLPSRRAARVSPVAGLAAD